MMALTIEIIEFLRVHLEYWKGIKEIKDLEIITQDLMADLEEIEEVIKVNKILDQFYDGQLQIKKKQLGMPSKD